MKLLLLAGTSEARDLATRLAQTSNIEAIASLAGATARPIKLDLPMRIGGFGGPMALQDWLREHDIGLVVDATHPFAAQMSKHARQACDALGLSRVQLMRPAWQAGDGDLWRDFGSIEDAANGLEPEAVAFLATGGSTIARFAERGDCRFVARVIDGETTRPAFANVTYLLGRPPFSVEDECTTLRQVGADVLVTKNAGGDRSASKLEAARLLGLPVFMIQRPPAEAGDVVADVQGAMDWVASNG